MTEYFYRKTGSADFEQTDSKKSVLFIRQKNKYLKTSQYFCDESYQWKDLDNHYDALIASQKYIPEELRKSILYDGVTSFNHNELARYNEEPSDEQMKILEKWHARHKLIYSAGSR